MTTAAAGVCEGSGAGKTAVWGNLQVHLGLAFPVGCRNVSSFSKPDKLLRGRRRLPVQSVMLFPLGFVDPGTED